MNAMKKFMTLLLILVYTFPLLAQDANPKSENEKSKKIKTEKSAKKSKKKEKETTPVITFEATVYDYGTIYQGDNGICEFIFTNTGKEDLVLTNVYSSCGCTVPAWPKEPISKKKSAVIQVKYDTNRIGAINKSITVESNAKNGRVVLKIQGTVLDKPNDAVPINMQNPLISTDR